MATSRQTKNKIQAVRKITHHPSSCTILANQQQQQQHTTTYNIQQQTAPWLDGLNKREEGVCSSCICFFFVLFVFCFCFNNSLVLIVRRGLEMQSARLARACRRFSPNVSVRRASPGKRAYAHPPLYLWEEDSRQHLRPRIGTDKIGCGTT